ncbi:MAG: hypothetical protein ACFE9T_03190 [Promethearchaeota archaeon]
MKTKVFVLQKNNELWKGEVEENRNESNKLVATLSSEQETVDDIIGSVKSQEFPWNFDYYEERDLKIEPDYSKEDLGFVPIEDIDLDQMSPKTIADLGKITVFRDTTLFEHKDFYWSEEDTKQLFIDLQHRKVFCLRFSQGNESRTFPKDLEVPTFRSYISDPKMDDEPFNTSKTIPKEFKPITIEFANSDSESQVATELLKDLRDCNHPSGMFFRSLGACIDQNYFWVVSPKNIEYRLATSKEIVEAPSHPFRIREKSFKGYIRRYVPKRFPPDVRLRHNDAPIEQWIRHYMEKNPFPETEQYSANDFISDFLRADSKSTRLGHELDLRQEEVALTLDQVDWFEDCYNIFDISKHGIDLRFHSKRFSQILDSIRNKELVKDYLPEIIDNLLVIEDYSTAFSLKVITKLFRELMKFIANTDAEVNHRQKIGDAFKEIITRAQEVTQEVSEEDYNKSIFFSILESIEGTHWADTYNSEVEKLYNRIKNQLNEGDITRLNGYI